MGFHPLTTTGAPGTPGAPHSLTSQENIMGQTTTITITNAPDLTAE